MTAVSNQSCTSCFCMCLVRRFIHHLSQDTRVRFLSLWQCSGTTCSKLAQTVPGRTWGTLHSMSISTSKILVWLILMLMQEEAEEVEEIHFWKQQWGWRDPRCCTQTEWEPKLVWTVSSETTVRHQYLIPLLESFLLLISGSCLHSL